MYAGLQIIKINAYIFPNMKFVWSSSSNLFFLLDYIFIFKRSRFQELFTTREEVVPLLLSICLYYAQPEKKFLSAPT